MDPLVPGAISERYDEFGEPEPAKHVANTPFFEPRLVEAERFDIVPTPTTTSTGKAVHWHPEGQLVVLADGYLVLDVGGVRWLMTPERLGWIPPGTVHAAASVGSARGWTAYLPNAICQRLSSEPAILKMSPLAAAILERISVMPQEADSQRARQNLVEVLLDEIAIAEADKLHLPMPRDKQLMAMAARIAADPADHRGLSDWAKHLAISERSLTRRFRLETGLSIGQWRTMARMRRASEMLTQGMRVTDAALDLGYDSLSSFIMIFRRTFGMTPARYVECAR